jgi:hypothetical protein
LIFLRAKAIKLGGKKSSGEKKVLLKSLLNSINFRVYEEYGAGNRGREYIEWMKILWEDVEFIFNQ